MWAVWIPADLTFDILEIIEALGEDCPNWAVNITDWGGPEDVQTRGFLSTEEVLALYGPERIVQTWDGALRAYPPEVTPEQAMADDGFFQESPALLEIRAVDSSGFAVITRCQPHIERLRQRFHHVTHLDPAHY